MNFTKICKAAAAQGWEVGQTKNGHWKLVPPSKDMPMVIAAGTPSDRRALNNFLAQMKRSGLEWPPPKKVKG